MKRSVIVVLMLTSLVYGKFDVSKFLRKIPSKNIGKVIKRVKISSYTKKLPKLKLVQEVSDEKRVLASVATKIANRGKFENRLISETKYPLEVVHQYSKYGDNYLDTMKYTSKHIKNISVDKLKNRFPSIPKINFKTSQEFNNKFIETLRYTGKRGWKASQELMLLAKKYPKSTVVTSLMAWYALDPESFFKQKEKLIDFVESSVKEGSSDVTKVILGATSGIANGVLSVAKEKITGSNIIILVLMFSFLAWKLYSYIKQYFQIKIENTLEKAKNKSTNLKHNQTNEEGLL